MESTDLKQSACCPTIRYSIDELLEHRSSLSYVICPIDGFTLVAWAEGLLDKIGDYVPEELAVRKQYAKEVTEMEEEAKQLLNPETMAKRKPEYVRLTFSDFLNLGKYGTPPKTQVGSASGSHSQEAQVTPPLAQVNPYTPQEGPESKSGTSTINPIPEKDALSQSSPRKGTEKPDTGTETVKFNPDGGAQASSHAELEEPAPSVEVPEGPEESGDIVDQDAWINAMLERAKIFAGNKYRRT